MLFDHGCDAFVSVLNPFFFLRLFNADIEPTLLLAYIIGCFPFYMVTLEAYYTGEMNMTEINGASEGSLM